MLRDLAAPSANAEADALLARLLAGPRRAALVYAGAGLGYGVVMATSGLLADGLEILPVRFLFLVWMFSWPVVLTIGIVAATTRRAKAMVTGAYFLGLMAIGAFAMSRSPDLTWPQVFLSWALYDLPPTLLLLTFLSRRVRAVGPLILTFMLLALIGSDVLVSVVGGRARYLRDVIVVTSRLGLGGTGTFIAMLVLGFLLFTVVGWAALIWIGRRYQAKKISDESVTVDAVWMLFTLVHSVNLVFGRPLWMFGGLAAFAVYTLIARLGSRWLAAVTSRSQRQPPCCWCCDRSRSGATANGFRHRRQILAARRQHPDDCRLDLVSRTVEPHDSSISSPAGSRVVSSTARRA